LNERVIYLPTTPDGTPLTAPSVHRAAGCPGTTLPPSRGSCLAPPPPQVAIQEAQIVGAEAERDFALLAGRQMDPHEPLQRRHRLRDRGQLIVQV